MSTRATILIKEGNEKVRMYHHHDGYPSGIGKDMKNYLKTLKWWDIEGITNYLIKGKLNGDNEYEYTICQHGDEEYAYLIDCDMKKLKCYKVGWDEYDWKESKVVEIPD